MLRHLRLAAEPCAFGDGAGVAVIGLLQDQSRSNSGPFPNSNEISDEIASLLTPVQPCDFVTVQGEMIDAETMLSIGRGNKAVVA
jgi:hypothetical protein